MKQTDDPSTTEGICDACGTTVERYRGESNIACPKCNAQYNCFGQRLRDDWAGNRSNWDDDVSDMDGFEEQQLASDAE